MIKILFLHQGLQSFVKKDLDILSQIHEVKELNFGLVISSDHNNLFKYRIHNFIGLIKNIWHLVLGVIWCDITFSWFGKLHAFFAVLFSKLFHKISIVVAGGEDVVYAPEINYGMFSFWWKKWCPLFVYRYTDLILPPGEFHNKILLENAKPDPKKVEVISHGFDYSIFKIPDGIKKNGSVITVGGMTEENFHRKGLKLFIEAASFLPEVQFYLVGPHLDSSIIKAKKIASDNVIFTGGLYGIDLIRVMSQAAVYVQVSEYEGFGCSLAEAMLCECVPVVSRLTAIPMVVGDCGFYVDDLNPKSVADKIKEALLSDMGQESRMRIMTEFPLGKRREALLAEVNKVISR